MSEEKNAFRDAAIEAISDMAQHLPLDCELLVVACRPGKKDFDLVLPSPESNLNNALDALRRNGLSIDGDNAYKRDLLDVVVGALALGAQNSSPPPSSHWATRFWEIGREERELHEELVSALRESRQVIATALKAGAPDWFDTDAKVAQHATVQRIDAVLAKADA
ncbi:hypothetical protein N5C62_22060 [Pseudomonas atacamensis]|uniref:hypothetical protein n=1 Tax=Pseudomonas atacamensis TaxID=2565368 RepID=UPI0024492FA8|nr:hypothetical protein [Pseudomonas atacamensis]MDH1260356.1 hypothetical protein [Pseudomonas atacamensis]